MENCEILQEKNELIGNTVRDENKSRAAIKSNVELPKTCFVVCSSVRAKKKLMTYSKQADLIPEELKKIQSHVTPKQVIG